MRLGTARAFDRIPRFIRADRTNNNPSGWLAPNRVSFQEASVAPGQTATFLFFYTVPQDMAPGTYTESFGLVADGVTWFSGLDITWKIRVVSLVDAYRAQLVNRSGNPTVTAGDSTGFEASFTNTGYITWKQGVFNLGIDQTRGKIPQFIRGDEVNHKPSGWITSNRVQLLQPSVPPGGVGTFRFYYTIPASMPSGTYREYFRPVAKGLTWLGDSNADLSWDIRVAR